MKCYLPGASIGAPSHRDYVDSLVDYHDKFLQSVFSDITKKPFIWYNKETSGQEVDGITLLDQITSPENKKLADFFKNKAGFKDIKFVHTPGVSGKFYPGKGVIELDMYGKNREEALFHELIHAFTAANLTFSAEARVTVRALQNEAAKYIKPENIQEVEALNNIQEFLTYGLTSPTFRAKLNNIPYTSKKSIWDALINWIYSALGVNRNSLLQESIRAFLYISNTTATSYEAGRDILHEQALYSLKQELYNSKPLTATEAPIKLEELYRKYFGATVLFHTPQESGISILQQRTKGFTTSDDEIHYLDEEGNVAGVRATAFVGDKTVGVFSRASAKFTDDLSTSVANKIFKENGKDITKDTVSIYFNGQTHQVTYEELKQVKELELAYPRIYGKMVHAYLQYTVEKDDVKKKEILTEVEKWAKQYKTEYTDILDHPDLKHIEYSADRILKLGGYDETESGIKIASELILQSKYLSDPTGLPIVTTADGLVEYANGDFSLFDFKTGDITFGMDNPWFMDYGAADLGINDSKLSRAYLELTLRALVIKENLPNAKFRDVKLVRIDGKGDNHTAHAFEMEKYLQLLANYMKATNPAKYEEMKLADLFNISNYTGVSEERSLYESVLKDKTHEGKIEWVENELAKVDSSPMKGSINEERKQKLTKLLLSIKKDTGVNINAITPDLSITGRYLNNLGDVSNPLVQTFHTVFIEKQDAVRKEMEKFSEEYKKKFNKILDERSKNNPNIRKALGGVRWAALAATVTTLNPIAAVSFLGLSIWMNRTGLTAKETFAFMWRKSVNPANPGYFLNLADTYYDEASRTEIPLTEAEKDYRQFIQRHMSALWGETMSAPVTTLIRDEERTISKAQSFNKSEALPMDFLPRIPIEINELRQRQALSSGLFGLKPRLKYWVKHNLSTFIESNFTTPTKGYGLPIQYYHHSGSNIVASGANESGPMHSFNIEQAVHLFTLNLLNKKHMDTLVGLGNGVQSILDATKNEKGDPAYGRLSEFFKDQMNLHVYKDELDTRLTTKDIIIPKRISRLFGVDQDAKLSHRKLLQVLKSSVSFGVMGFKVIGATFNGLLITVTNVMNGSKGLFYRALGVPPEEINASLSTTGLGFKDMMQHFGQTMTGKGDSSKLMLLAKELNWLPENFEFRRNANHWLVKSTSPAFMDNAYMFHNFFETYGALWHMAAMLRATKVKAENGETKSLWDLYEVEGGELKWKGGKRGVVKLDNSEVELRGIDAREAKALRKAYELLHGSYRDEEKIALEASVIGGFVVQFKKFFFRYMKNLMSSPRRDFSLGKYKTLSTRPDGVDVYTWEGELMEGRLRAMASGIIGMVSDPSSILKTGDVSKEEQSIARKKRQAEVLNTALWVMMLLPWVLSFFSDDDDDKLTYTEKRFKRLVQDASQGMSPTDLLSAVDKPVVAASYVSKMGKAFFEMASFEHDKAGNLKGSKTFFSNLPISHNLTIIKEVLDK